ncbi:hypothetical protein [Deinococcus sonorensis]|uniref:Uncharacterized protein n=2 Tax=Deinococcus sonorensis TaxID=309891 RepID=A0AAU7U7Y3_9DEIO
MTNGKQISPEDRQKYDQIFMQVVMGVQQEVQQSQPVRPGNLAAMFHKEQVSEALQGCAMLIAGWNEGRIDEAGVTRAARALRGLDQPDLAGRVEGLTRIDEPEPQR